MDDSPPAPPTAEHARLAEATGRAETDLFTANPWYEWGPYLSERAWGTVREDYSADGDAWRSFPHDHARSRALPVERGRDGRHLGHPPRALPRAGPVERRGPDPQGADVRPGRPRGQPRRGRQGVLVVPRGPAEPRPAALALPLPAGRLPVRTADRARPRAAGPRARAARHRRLRRRPVLVGRRHLRQGDAHRGADAGRRREPRPGRGDHRRAAHAVVPQHLVVGGGRTPTAHRP